MFGVSLLNPILITTAILAIIPIALHYITHRGSRILDFSTLMFLRQAIARKAKQFRLENRRLLLLRILAILLIAIALARPVLRFSGTALVRPGTHTTAVFIIDNSMSMAAVENAKIRFDRAKEAAFDILDHLTKDDQVALFFASSAPEVVFSQPTSLLEDCRDQIANAKVSYRKSDIRQCLNQALEMLNLIEAGAREIYIISDMQVAPWTDLEKIPEEARTKGINIYICDVGQEQSPNTAITGVSTDPAIARPESIVSTTFKITQFSPYTANNLGIVCQFSTAEQPRATLNIDPGKTAEQIFRKRYKQTGVQSGFARIDRDVLDEDNTAYFATLITLERNVLICEGSPGSAEEGKPSSYFLAKALEVYGKGSADNVYLHVTVEGAVSGLPSQSFSGYDLIVLSNIARLKSDDVFRIKTFVQSGGGVLIFLGDRTDADAWNREAVPSLIPGKLVAVTKGKNSFRPENDYALLERNDYEHPALTLFRTLANGDLRLPEIYKYFVIEPVQDARILSRFGAGHPAILENTLGRGSVITVAFSADDSWSNFPYRKIYLPLWSEFTRYLTSRTTVNLMFTVGQPVGIRVDLRNTVQRTVRIPVQKPDGTAGEIQVPGDTLASTAFFADTQIPGIYRITAPPGSPISQIYPEAFAVNPDPGESDLAKISKRELDKALNGFAYRYFDSPKTIARSLHTTRTGAPLWTGFLLLVLAVLAGESFYSHRVWR